ncbi:MAG: signal peptidase I [Hyphomonadaceae bacterium]
MTMTSESRSSALDSFWENVRTIVYALALAMLIRFTVAQPFRIPSGSMQPTLEVGDYIVVTKWTFGYSRFSFAPLEGLLPGGRLFDHTPDRGEIVVFRPEGETRDFVKRLIGMPGDRIQMVDGVLHINGEPVERESLGLVAFERPDGVIEDIPAFRETLPGGRSYVTFDRYPDWELDDTQVFVVPADNYFMMGDDRDNSQDSRTSVVGYVPNDNLIGPAQFVFASFDGSTSLFQPWTLFSGFRGERFLKPVH